MFKVMKQNKGSTDKVFSFSLREVCTFSEENHSTEKAEENTAENITMPSEEELAAKLAKIEQNAHEQGFAVGEKAGQVSGMNKLEPLRQTLLKMTDEMQNLKASVLKECEEDIIAMALAITRRILGHEVEISPETLLGYIEKGIRKIDEEDRLLVRLHPHDLENMTQVSDLITPLLEAGRRFRFEPDRSLSPGECIMEGRERVVDARPKTQLAFFEAALMEVRPS